MDFLISALCNLMKISQITHIHVLKIALDNSYLSSQVWVAQLDQAECCHKSCSLFLDQTSLWRRAEIRY